MAAFQHDLLVQKNERQFLQEMDAMDKTWRTGERIDAQDFEKVINNLNQDFEASQNDLNRVLQLDIQGNDIAYRESAQAASEEFEALMQSGEFTQQEAMQQSSQVFAQSMQEAGFTQEQALQSAGIVADMNSQQTDIQARETMLAVQLAQDSVQFQDSLNLDKKKLEANTAQNADEMRLAMDQFGLNKTQVDAALASAEVQDALGAISMAMEMLPDDEEALKPFTERLFTVMGGAAGLDENEIAAALAAKEAGPEGPVRQTPTKATTLANSVISGDTTKEAALETIQSYSSEEWARIASNPGAMDAI